MRLTIPLSQPSKAPATPNSKRTLRSEIVHQLTTEILSQNQKKITCSQANTSFVRGSA